MDGLMNTMKMVLARLIELGVGVVLLAIVIGVLFGDSVPFLKASITDNLIDILSSLDAAGLAGIVAIGVVYWIARGARLNF